MARFQKVNGRYGAPMWRRNTGNYGAMLGGCLPDGSYCFVFNNAASKE